nr:unnamed protein product [Callosobruchus analis]
MEHYHEVPVFVQETNEVITVTLSAEQLEAVKAESKTEQVHLDQENRTEKETVDHNSERTSRYHDYNSYRTCRQLIISIICFDDNSSACSFVKRRFNYFHISQILEH